VAKILLADDNSNVHKTVALALAPLGIDIVSVSNGEAAIRKLSEFTPDLVVADIFMPVLSGYEVCELLKKNPKFAHIPVVLLAGAFDPLDEHEAQRVGADGILKKPFVPPDPLITMVQTLLQRQPAERLPEASSPKKKGPVRVLETAGQGTVAEPYPSSPDASAESSEQEFPTPAARVAFGEDEPPVAFGTLLETADREPFASDKPGMIEPVDLDDEQILTGSRNASAINPIFWKSDSAEVKPQEEHSLQASSKIEPPAWAQAEDAMLPPVKPLEQVRDGQDETSPSSIESLELVREEPDDSSASTVDSAPVQLDPAAGTPLTAQSGEAEDLAANPLEWLAASHPEELEPHPEPAPGRHEPIPDAAGTAVHSHAQIAQEFPAQTPPQPELVNEATVRPITMDEWSELSATIEAGTLEVNAEMVGSTLGQGAQIPSAETKNSGPASPTSQQSSAPDPALVDAVVQRVIDKMSPQVVDIITREFLRPIVQALVHRTIEKK
jgi:CheY-like chemotaxis protein